MTDDGLTSASGRAKTGIDGLDDVLAGGLQRDRLYLVEGNPGTGKTTLALQFLIEGAQQGEKGLYITLGETEAELRAGALRQAQKQRFADTEPATILWLSGVMTVGAPRM